MSLLSPESLSVFVSPTELVAVRWRGISQQIVEKRIHAVAEIPGKTWEGAAHAFADLMRGHSTCRQVRVILSNHLTSYQLLPWREDLNDSDEELAVARMAFTATYGTAAAQWQVRLNDEVPGVPKLAAAVDAELLAALQHTADANKARLVSVEPYLAAAINYWRKRFNRSYSSWIVLHEEGRICIALIERGVWRWVRSLRTGVDWSASLPDMLDNEMLLAGIENSPSQALIFSPATPELAVRSGSRWSLRSLTLDARTNFSPVGDAHFGLALVG